MSNKLTEKQNKMLNFIKSYIEQHGFAPTYREMRDFIDVKSNQTIKDYLISLENKGMISVELGKVRGISLTPFSETSPKEYIVFTGNNVRLTTTDRNLGFGWAELFGNLQIRVI